MAAFILGIKSTQSQRYSDQGEKIPTTFIKTDTCWITDIKSPAKQGYFSIKLGIGETKNIKKPVKIELEKAGIKTPLRFLREIRLEKFGDKVKMLEEKDKKGIVIGETKLYVGEILKPAVLFKKGDRVTVSGISKGKGFQGGVRRHHFKGGSKTHGQSHSLRAPGSIGMTTTPGRVFRGKRMAGRMGTDRVTVKGLEIVEIKDDGMIIKGLVPGFKGGLLEIKN